MKLILIAGAGSPGGCLHSPDRHPLAARGQALGKPEDATLATLVGGADAGACEEDDEPPTDDEAERGRRVRMSGLLREECAWTYQDHRTHR